MYSTITTEDTEMFGVLNQARSKPDPVADL